jgi:hypothetical protein
MRINRLRSLRRVSSSAVDGVRQTNHPNPKTLTNTAINVTNTPDVQHARPAPVTAPKPIASPTPPPVGSSLSFTFPATIEHRQPSSAVPAEWRYRRWAGSLALEIRAWKSGLVVSRDETHVDCTQVAMVWTIFEGPGVY